ncbi:MAG TPA: TIGR03560 family F420-dependent LLM class oxidoreductase [Acidimicrobiales bacterium]|jgi:F420-dependent oxidoreductase-like protein|nr:TIGR03560 family F420-dependent LLM class oxidoreductase [Acidimicrobiales bacterium]
MRLRITTEPQLGSSYSDILGLARAAEYWKFDGFFRSDHYMMNYGDRPAPPGPSDAWITLAGLARETSSIRLGTLVTPVTFRHPGPLAVAVAQVDAMSGGRIELGLGSGWFEREHAGYGIPFPSVEERFDRLEELLRILNAWWSTDWGGTFDHRGQYFDLVGCPALPQPVQGHVPIILGGWGRHRTPLLAASFADEYNLAFGTPGACREQYDRVLAACDVVGRDPTGLRWSTVVTICCGEDGPTQVRRAALAGWDPVRLRSLPGRIIGTTDEVTERLVEYWDAGVDTVYLQILDMGDLEHLALLGQEVAPRVSAI